jgi:hypothetical protein
MHPRAVQSPPGAPLQLQAMSMASYLAADSCGATVMNQTFDQYAGDFTNYTRDMLDQDFPRLSWRSSADGVDRQTGWTFYTAGSEERAFVGQGQLRCTHPLGELHTVYVMLP